MHGTFAWHELMTPDPRAAIGFYTRVLGWETKPWGADGGYTLWMNGPRPVGGCLAMPAALETAGVAPHWLTHIGSADVDATCAKATALGATIRKAPFDVPGEGRVAVLADPAGAVFGVYRPSDVDPGGPGGVGDFSWHDLATSDPVGGLAFYGALFGWKAAGEFDMGPAGVYRMFGQSEVPIGGIHQKPAEAPPHWLPYVRVKQVDQSVVDLKPLGGGVLFGPASLPGGDRVATAVDPQGAVFALHAVKR